MDLRDFAKRPELAYHCFLCGTCKAVCPKQIDGKTIALELRKKTVEHGGGKLPDNSYDGLLLEKSPYKFANYRHADSKSVLFTGCNFPSFYPETTQKLVDEFAKHDVGVVYDCCGKPVEELGLYEDAKGIIARINDKLNRAGVEEVIILCPNCYYFLQGRLDAKIVSVYEKMREYGIGHAVKLDRIPMYYPCPDRDKKEIMADIRPLLKGEELDAFPDTQCCGLGGCAAGKEADLVQKIAEHVKESPEKKLYTYCASCICSFRRRGYEGAKHLLPVMMDVDEKVPLGKTPILNRARCKFK
jgi:Fe-S oxidoreductase